MTDDELQPILKDLRDRAGPADLTGDWPAADLADLAAAGAMRWAVPRQYGGDDLSPLDLHLRYEQIASASLTTALALSQRDSAVGFIESAENEVLQAELLPRLARHETFATIGIAQLTTSSQRGPAALSATLDAGGNVRLSGFIPWATGAARAEHVIVGAVLDDGKQLLLALPMKQSGVRVEPPMPLVALRASWTSRITCDDVVVEPRFILRGPVPQALGGRRRHLPIGQAFLAMGLCRAALDLIRDQGSERSERVADRFDEQFQSLRHDVLNLSQPGREDEASTASPRIRGACNDLAIRTTTAAVTLYKGSGLLLSHPAQRLAREAMFLLVWSCPSPVIDCTVDLLTASPRHE